MFKSLSKEGFNKISVKYAAAFIAVALSMLVIVVVDERLVNAVKGRMTTFSGEFNVAISSVLNADRDLYQGQMSVLELLNEAPGSNTGKQFIAAYEDNAGQAYARMNAFAERMSEYPSVVVTLEDFEGRFEAWANVSENIIELHRDGDIEKARTLFDEKSMPLFNELREIYDLAGQAANTKVTELETSMLDRINTQQTWVIIISAIIFLAAIALALIGPRRMSTSIRDVSERIREIADGDGDLTQRIDSRRRDEIGELSERFNAFIDRIDRTLQAVRSSTQSVNSASDEIAKSSQELASRTEQTASNLQETSSSMEEITATVRHTAETATQADELSRRSVEVTRDGQAAMQDVETTMNDISESASRINEIIGMIDSIAFQTNILALNASVEAARAGEHGKGFAVVAEEVRTLAGRSSDASREIRELVKMSVSNAESGSEKVRKAGQTMEDIAGSIERVTQMIGEISTGSQEQSSGISQVNTAVTELDTMTQQNAAMVEQSSAAADEMNHQAERLMALIGAFKLGHTEEEAPQMRQALPHRQSDASQSGEVQKEFADLQS
ncbi:methyl-accepting chemotaxis sensory transducer [Chromohalobacter marismortui]|uniref:Methyl-accepting chemotaxis sensory transducer n=1 Tax=Chromohalobacter marismortui TaxID=42055 RepID=A0A4R7NQM1_9GAMM|nr:MULTISPECIES: methyl-accepting chemotaxis protein [Chromohalobacter]MCI0508826.1 methyl-accepting chemotaxis protein [Chromohalobacter sp.]MCI0594317.1 methyl-accepting chemotaxis protein [Chromohalobacter sp.]TDU22801.1 methyl-accepting chemotaxis sensory transducer [Chromohalobacter marismortui]